MSQEQVHQILSNIEENLNKLSQAREEEEQHQNTAEQIRDELYSLLEEADQIIEEAKENGEDMSIETSWYNDLLKGFNALF